MFIDELDKMPTEKTSFHEIGFLMKKSEDMDDEGKKHFEYEKIALSFSTDSDEKEYYRPCFSGKNEDGSEFEFPNKTMVTKETLNYWRERANETGNPLLKLRYLGLQIEFRPLVGDKIDGKELFAYIDSIVDAIDNDLFKYSNEGFQHLERALKIAVTTKNTPYIEKVKTAFFNYDSKYSTDETPGLYSNIVFALKKNPAVFTDEEKEQIEKSVLSRYDRLYNSDKHYFLNECMELLVDYYGVKNREKTLNILRQFEGKTYNLKDSLGAMRTQIFLHRINQHYFTMNSKEDMERVNVEIAKLGPEVVKSLNPVEIPISDEIKKEIDKANEYLTTGELNERLIKFINVYWHHKNTDQASADQQKKNSIVGLFATVVYDQTGRPATLGQSSTDENDKGAVEYFRSSAPMMAVLHHTALLENIKDNVIGKETAIDIISHCPSFSPASIPLIDKALDAYYEEDYVHFMHLIIPQIERACRNFVAIKDESTYSTKGISGGYNFLTFEGVLRTQCLQQIKNGNLAYHLMAVFTDSHGLNLRNEIMHGMAPISYFSYPFADIVFHSLILTATLLR